MGRVFPFTRLLLLLFISTAAQAAFADRAADALSAAAFAAPPDDAKIHTWWHWVDGAITREGITKDLEAMKAQDIVQATILNIGLIDARKFGVPQVKFGSPQWFEMFRWALVEANRLGIKLGVHNCDGWSSTGGPWITPEMSMKQLVWTRTFASGGGEQLIRLRKPFELQGFYRDVAVVAYRTEKTPSEFQHSNPRITREGEDLPGMADGNPASGVLVKEGDSFLVALERPVVFDQLALFFHQSFSWSEATAFKAVCRLEASRDGTTYETIKEFTFFGLNRTHLLPVPRTGARFVRLVVTGLTRMHSFMPVRLTELELLREGELPHYSPSIPFLLEKTGATKPRDQQSFETRTTGGAAGPAPSATDVKVLTDKMQADGSLRWAVPTGKWVIVRFGYTTTGATNLPATREGKGLECDKMDPAALDLHFRNFPAKLVEHAGRFTGNTFKFLFVDSWECAFQNWTARFPAEFEKRRGYTLIPYLPVLAGDIVGSEEESEAVLFDFRRTIGELIEENYYRHYAELCHRNKLEFHAEVIYGNTDYPPLDILKSTRHVDLPMYEFWAGGDADSLVEYRPAARQMLNLPSCAAIGYEKPVVGSEAYTGYAHYSESFNDLKGTGDRAFCSGINQMILHSYVHQPTEHKPGLTLGQFAAHFNRHNLYWPSMAPWLAFQSRVQWMLQKGTTAGDVLYYLGDQLPQFYAYNESNSLPFGYRLNACNFDILDNRVQVVDGRLRLNGRADYGLLGLPPQPGMKLETLKRIETLVREGAVVYGPKPLRPLGRTDTTQHLAVFRELADRIWGTADGTGVLERAYGKGKILWGMSIAEALSRINLPPDLSFDPPEDKTLQFIHKLVGGVDVYYVANQQDRPVARELRFRVGEKLPEIWDPETGLVARPAVFRFEDGQVRLPFRFEPRQSVFFVFSKGQPADFVDTVTKDGTQLFPGAPGQTELLPDVTFAPGGFQVAAKTPGEYRFSLSRTKRMLAAKLSGQQEQEVRNFEGTIEFQAEYPARLEPVRVSSLKSLTDFAEPDIRYFSGNASYRLSFVVPHGFDPRGGPVFLNIGDFESVAAVRLNGKELGRVWRPGTRLDVTGLLKEENELHVVVANVYRNRLIGDLIQYGSIKNLFTSSPVTDFLSKEKPLKPSGLLGLLKLIRVDTQLLEAREPGSEQR